MEEYKRFLMQFVETIEWQDPEACKVAAKDIMEHFSEAVGNMTRSIVMNSIYQVFYAGFDAVSDMLIDRGLDGNNLWVALHNDVAERYADKPLVRLLAVLSILAQEARCNSDKAVDILMKMRPLAFGIAMDQLAADPDVNAFCRKISASIFANTFRQLSLEQYGGDDDKSHDAFLAFYKDFCKSDTVMQGYGEDLLACARQLMSKLSEGSDYRKQYAAYCKSLQG